MKPSFYLLIFFISLLLLSCQNNSNESLALTDSTSVTGLTRDSIKLVKTGSLNFKVKDIEQGARAISNMARNFGGMLFNQNIEYEETERNELRISTDSLMVVTVSMPRANITVRVPSENLEEFMYAAADFGYFTSSSKLDIDDQSLKYLENVLKQKNRIEILSPNAVQKGKPLTDLQAIGVKDAVTEQQMMNRTIDAEANYSIVNLTLSQNPLVRKEVISNYVVSSYQLPFSQSLGISIRNGWQFFLSFILVLANVWVFILIGVGIFLSYRHLQQRRKFEGINVKVK